MLTKGTVHTQVVLGTKHAYTFDCVYGGNGRNEEDMFHECIRPLVQGIVEGYNGTVRTCRVVKRKRRDARRPSEANRTQSILLLHEEFEIHADGSERKDGPKPKLTWKIRWTKQVFAYGQTGSGKTYTMGSTFVGKNKDVQRGVIPQTIHMLHELLESNKENKEVQLKVSFIELHKEAIQDLLADPSESPKQCFVREYPGGKVTVSGATELDVKTPQEMFECLEKGTLYRTTASTGMNKKSSRSHAIFTITVVQTPHASADAANVQGGDGVLMAKLNLVDLAGSERVKKTNAEGLRLEEGIHINKGLLALGNVISALGGENRILGHIPYRNSKLTRLLQDSLGGNSRTVMVACVSPADINFDETLNTLKYANRARNIKNKPIVNRDGTTAEILNLRREVAELTAELQKVKSSGKVEGTDEMDQMLVSELEARCLAAEAESNHLRGELASARAGEELAARRLLQVEKQRDFYRMKVEMIAAEHPDLVPEITSEDLSILEEHLATIQALEKTVSRYSHLEAAGATCIFEDEENFASNGSVDCARTLDFGSEEKTEDFEEGQKMHMQKQQEWDQELGALEASLLSKEEQMRQMSTAGEKLNAITSYYESTLKEIAQERLQLLEERNELLEAMQESKKANADERMSLEAKYKQMLKDLETKLGNLQEKANGYAKLEKLKQKSERALSKLESEIFQIKQHRVQLMKKVEAANKDFAIWKKEKQKELMQLVKEKRKDRIQLARLELINKKQEMILKRKTEEAAAAKARVQDLLKQRSKGVQDQAQTNAPMENYSALVIRPNQSAPQLHNEKQRRVWLAQEIANLAKMHELRLEMVERIAQRLETARMIDHLKASLNEESTVDKKASIQQKIDRLEEDISNMSACIQQMQSELVNSESHSPSEFSPQEIQRWLGLRSLPEARCMLRTLFRCATASAISSKKLQKDMSLQQAELASLQRQHGVLSKEHLLENTAPNKANASKVGLLAATETGSEDEDIIKLLREQREECNVFQSLHPDVCLDSSTNFESQSDSFSHSGDSATSTTSQLSEVTRSVRAAQDSAGCTESANTGPSLKSCPSDPNYSTRSSAIKSWWNSLDETVLLELVQDYPKARESLVQNNVQGIDGLKDLLSSFHGAAFWYYRFKRIQMQKDSPPGGRRLDGVFDDAAGDISPPEALFHRPSGSVLKTIQTSAKLREGAREARERIERYLKQSTVQFSPKQARKGVIST